MKIKKVNVKKILDLDNGRFYKIDNEFGLTTPMPGYVWKLFFYKEVNEYLDSKKQKKTVTVNV